jgi:hypothetical protein
MQIGERIGFGASSKWICIFTSLAIAAVSAQGKAAYDRLTPFVT